MACLRSILRSSSDGAMVPGGGSSSVAPLVNATNTCSMEVSKAMEAICATRSSSAIPYSPASSSITPARLRWLTATGLGSPVDPEV